MLSLNRITAFFVLMLITLISTGCSKNESNFAEMPGFKQYFSENKPTESLPSKADQALLNQYKPRIFMAEGQTSFIDFYSDYISQGALYIDNKLVNKNVTQSILNEHKDNARAEFRYTATKQSVSPTLYARIHRDKLSHNNQELPLTFLSYNLVFANSGLLKGLATWQRIAMGIVGDNNDWHQLDHYVGLTIALFEDKPIAVTLQQHNYQTTFLLTDKNTENSLKLPEDLRVKVDVAMQSNELYPHSTELKKHAGLSWVSEDSIEFLKTGKNKPMMAGWDITHGEVEQEYTLKFLPTADAFYTFKGKLGQSRSLPGRDGPPGANYVTLPKLMPWANRMVSGYRPKDLNTERRKINALIDADSFSVKPQGLNAYKRDFIEDLGKCFVMPNLPQDLDRSVCMINKDQ